MDTITLRDIKLETIIGIHAWEQQLPQKLIVDITFQTDAKNIAATDNIEYAIDYERVIKELFDFAKSHTCKLIETFADQLAYRLLENFPTTQISLTVHKPGALKEAKDVAINVTRSR